MRGAVVSPERAAGSKAGSKAAVAEPAFQLINPHPLGDTLPGVYRDSWLDERRRTAREPFGARFISALDTVLSPVLATLDNLDAYLDADTTPEDFLAWLGEWVAASVDASWPEDRRRAFVGQAAELYRRRGTAAGLRDHVLIHTGGLVEIVENGASGWSPKPDGKLPGSPEPVVVVRVTVDDPESIDRAKLDAMVHASKPAHVVHRVEIVGSAQRASRKTKAAPDLGAPDAGSDDASDGGSQVPGATAASDATQPDAPKADSKTDEPAT
ncbi:MAG TPA: phage tail protein [Candidatus Limnocylindria bacterium]|nr:phage tail protein [Candidatus Limnocylindria bacterium]